MIRRLIWAFGLNEIRSFRAWFVYVLLPLAITFVLLLAFGGTFSSSYMKVVDLTGQVLPSSSMEVVRDVPFTQAMRMLRRGDVSAVVTREGEKYVVYVLEGEEWMARSLRFGGATLPDWVRFEEVKVGRTAGVSAEFYVTGMLVLSLMSVGTYGLISGIETLRGGIARRLAMLGVSAPTSILSAFVVYVLFDFINIAIYLMLVPRVYGVVLKPDASILWVLPLVMLAGLGFGAVLLRLFGLHAFFAANVGMQLLCFFSGIYFPVDFVPKWMRVLTYISPLYHGVRLMRWSLGVFPYQDVVPSVLFLAVLALFIPLSFGFLRTE